MHEVPINIHNAKCQGSPVPGVRRTVRACDALEETRALKAGTPGFQFQLCQSLCGLGQVIGPL